MGLSPNGTWGCVRKSAPTIQKCGYSERVKRVRWSLTRERREGTLAVSLTRSQRSALKFLGARFDVLPELKNTWESGQYWSGYIGVKDNDRADYRKSPVRRGNTARLCRERGGESEEGSSVNVGGGR